MHSTSSGGRATELPPRSARTARQARVGDSLSGRSTGVPVTLPTALPLGEQARVKREKVRDYMLDPDHPTGQHKARLWRQVFGVTRDDHEMLRGVLQQAGQEGRIVGCRPGLDIEVNPGSQTWAMDYEWQGPNGVTGVIRIDWNVRMPGMAPRLSSAWPK